MKRTYRWVFLAIALLAILTMSLALASFPSQVLGIYAMLAAGVVGLFYASAYKLKTTAFFLMVVAVFFVWTWTLAPETPNDIYGILILTVFAIAVPLILWILSRANSPKKHNGSSAA